MIKYEIREKHPVTGDKWHTVGWYDTISEARKVWSSTPHDGIEAALVKIVQTEEFEHYHSADGKEVY